MLPTPLEDIVRVHNEGDICSASGRVTALRNHGGLSFIDVRDHTRTLQVVVDRNQEGAFASAGSLTVGSYVCVEGTMQRNKRGDPEVYAARLENLAPATLPLSPTPWQIDGNDPAHGRQVFGLTSLYVSNPQRAAVLKAKTEFVIGMHRYFQDNGFTLVEPPIITNKTLYGDGNAIRAATHGEELYLSQCATFELEPLALAFGKVYTISPAFRNEKGGSKRHLAEYTHAKAEALLIDTEGLMALAGESIHAAASWMVERSERELALLGAEIDLELLHPDNHERISYADALRISQARGSRTKYGEGLRREDEIAVTQELGNRYVWVMNPPAQTEGFPYKRLASDPSLSTTCDLIAPHDSGEMVGIAEKITDPEELIENLISKGLKDEVLQYWDYILLRFYGLPEHGGIGAAPERIVYGLLGLDHVRLTKPWPRYPGRRTRVPKETPLNPWGDPLVGSLIEKYDLR